ncbi:NUDIX hydrolase [Roseibium algae]|uniref:NUDIX hydrolase n=1 Tax=Roseibium algae TaxID=3123038 RepID=A0ABU8TP11_9HYPH
MNILELDWVLSESKVVIKDRWIHLRADTCSMPDGTVVEPYYVLEYPDWVSVLAIDTEGRAILVKEYRHGAALKGLGLVGGVIDPKDASPEDAARRELEEETGYMSVDFICLGSGYANWANQNNRIHYYLAQNSKLGGKAAFDPTEHCELILADMSQLFEPGYLKQSFHLANVFLAQKHLDGAK